ncbi:MAG: hypothetical protein QXE05_12710 [Nitrososphaeria archaeon]
MNIEMKTLNTGMRTYGKHLTHIQIFKEYILPEIKDDLYKYVWVDLFVSEGNFILPILEIILENNRIEFFKKHFFLFDIQESLVNKAIDNAKNYDFTREIAQKISVKCKHFLGSSLSEIYN